MRLFGILIVTAASLVASAGDTSAQDAAVGEKVFAQCRICHQIGENAINSYGPVLNGVVADPSDWSVGKTKPAAVMSASPGPASASGDQIFLPSGPNFLR